MKVTIIGSRKLKADISQYMPEYVTEIISGGAKGIDSLAEEYADKNNIAKRIVKPDYVKYKKAAPLKRNELIVNMADIVVAVWNGKSRGTKYTVEYAMKTGKPLIIHII